MHQRPGRVALLAVLLAVATTTAAADAGGQNDAGTGADAGNARGSATTVAIGAQYLGNKLRVDDVDWYAAEVPGPAASCVRAVVSVNAPTYFALGAESGATKVGVPFRASPGSTTSAGVAGVSPLTATLRAAQTPGVEGQSKYDFRLELVEATGGGGDAGLIGDAGDSAGTATLVEPGCVKGALTGIDIRDTFAIDVPAGDSLTYSLASASSAVRVALTDALGNTVGPSIAPGESARVAVSAPGTYYMSASQTTSFGDAAYVIGAVSGPEPTGCRPYCME